MNTLYYLCIANTLCCFSAQTINNIEYANNVNILTISPDSSYIDKILHILGIKNTQYTDTDNMVADKNQYYKKILICDDVFANSRVTPRLENIKHIKTHDNVFKKVSVYRFEKSFQCGKNIKYECRDYYGSIMTVSVCSHETYGGQLHIEYNIMNTDGGVYKTVTLPVSDFLHMIKDGKFYY